MGELADGTGAQVAISPRLRIYPRHSQFDPTVGISANAGLVPADHGHCDLNLTY